MDFIEQAILEGVAFEDLGLDIDEMADLDGFFEWLMYEPESDEMVWDEELCCWVYPDDEYDEDEEDDYEW